MPVFNPNIQATTPPPVMEARRWTLGVTFPPDRPLINVSQAAPVDPPHPELRRAIADAALNEDSAHLYGPVLGLPDLRAEVAHQWAAAYGGEIAFENVAITSGCNQAFAATMATIAAPGDEVILPTPWYFNHKMWLDMGGIKAVPLATGDDLLPDPKAAEALITPRTRAISLVTPNNPGGVEYPAALVRAFFALAQAHDIVLIIDETYRDFDSRDAAPHDLFMTPDWQENLVQLYSFSKAYRLTGHRVGAMVASPERLAQVEKFLDTVTICPAQLGQHAALWGMRHLSDWVGGERLEILDRRAAVEEHFSTLTGWRILGCGAYFAYVEHPFDTPSQELCQRLVKEASILALPGSMFMPEGDPAGDRQLRIAFANIDRAGIATLADRLRDFTAENSP
ncbi:aminotransferase [Aliiroseovarius sp.]|uniref:aminotransferase n=1 Tax=Aliiroseovarius sp. TaxID=1872442 RepID=UPI00260DC528|nr:aminotransferase [Aliiroseovarius sp.]